MPGVQKIDAERIRQLLAQGVPQKHIAQRLGCSTTAVQRVAKGQSTSGRRGKDATSTHG